jgi:hypothetical protein
MVTPNVFGKFLQGRRRNKMQRLLLIVLCLSALVGFATTRADQTITASKDIINIPEPGFNVLKKVFDPDRPTRPATLKYTGSIIDTHVHLDLPQNGLYSRGDLKQIIADMKDAGVELAIFMPTPNEGRIREQSRSEQEKLDLMNLDKKRIKLFCGSDYLTYWLHRAHQDGYKEKDFNELIKKLNNDLDSGSYAGVGELAFYHFEKYPGQNVIMFPPNYEPFLKILDLTAKRSVWVDLHAEPITPTGQSYENEVFGGIELFFRRNPDLKLIYSHTAMTNSKNVEALLKKYPHLMMNIKMVRNHDVWQNLESVVNAEGEFYEDWAELFEKMPERFMIGSDTKFGRNIRGSMSDYSKQIRQVRKALGSLNPEASKMIAYTNAEKWLRE